MIKKYKKSIFICVAVVILSIAIISIGRSFSQILDNDVRVQENSDLTYYLDVIYDGKDSNVITSSDSATANVNSDYIYVEDKLPEGLTFKNFVSTSDGTIGAVKRSDGSSCPGQVVGGVSGLKYDESTRMVSFKIKNLQAGCKLTVGIVTRTPYLEGKSRMDFYNMANARENTFSANSNTVHVFMGKDNVDVYSVNYSYGSAPEGVPGVPSSNSYSAGNTVGVAANPTYPGYTFSGWTTSDVTVSNNKFTMPSKNVNFVGSFVKKSTYNVNYSITGTGPEGYMVPKSKSYGIQDEVTLDSLKEGDIVGGYRFLGWTSSNVTIEDGKFKMPGNNVSIVGRFERISYKVSYQFQGTVAPSNATSLLPAEASYHPGDEVTVASNPTASGYKFLGWYSSKTFEMPEEDVVIYGEWMLEAGKFSPTIATTITDKKEYYKKNDTVQFKITVRNTASYAIKDVMLQEKLADCVFISGSGYQLLNEQYVKISSIAANSSVVVNAKYTVKDDILKEYSNEVVLTGALADGNNNLDTSKEYKTIEKFKVSNIKLKVENLDERQNALSGAQFTLYGDMSLTSEISSGLEFLGLYPNTSYYLKETKVPTGYKLLKNALKVDVNSTGEISIENYQVQNNNGVGTVKIVNDPIDILPNTGGLGNVLWILAGIAIIGIASVVFIFHSKKKDKVKDDENII